MQNMNTVALLVIGDHIASTLKQQNASFPEIAGDTPKCQALHEASQAGWQLTEIEELEPVHTGEGHGVVLPRYFLNLEQKRTLPQQVLALKFHQGRVTTSESFPELPAETTATFERMSRLDVQEQLLTQGWLELDQAISPHHVTLFLTRPLVAG